MDEDLAALRAGKTSAACERIVALHGPLVKSACHRVLRDEALAEDAAQETFVLLMKKACSLPPDTSLAGWLYHAACRTALNHQRTAMRRRVRENSLEAIHQMTPDTEPNLWTEIEPHLDEAMLALPERQRDLVVQCYFQNQSQRSAAASLGCSESVVSRELGSAIKALRQFFTKRRVTISGVALTSLLSANAASGMMAGSAAMVTAMMATTTASTMLTTLMSSKLALAAVAVIGTATIATVSYRMASSGTDPHGQAEKGLTHASGTSKAGTGGTHNGRAAIAARRGKWESSFQFTSLMALDERKKQVLLESDPEVRYAMLQKMGVQISRAAFDQLIAKDLDASVSTWRSTFVLLANRTEAFDNYLMAWSNEDPLAVLDWVTAQPDGGWGLRKQLLYVLSTKQIQSETLRQWMGGLTAKGLQQDVIIALEAMADPASVIARMGAGGNEGYLVDLAMLQGGPQIDWSAFGRKLAAGRSAIVARAMKLAMDGEVSPQHLEQMIQELARSSDRNISTVAVAILRAARGDAGMNYPNVLELAASSSEAGMHDFKASIFQGWAGANPESAMQHASQLKDLAGMRDVIRGMRDLPDESTLLSWTAGASSNTRDIALTCLYGRTADDPFALLQRIMQSTTIVDQVAAASEVLRGVPLSHASAAAQWLKQVPVGKDRQELAFDLARRLAAVDPQAALDLVVGEGLLGREYADSVSHAVMQFAAQNDLDQSTQFIQQITDLKAYGEALGQLAMVKFVGRPQEAFAYLKAHSRGNWQQAALRMLTDHYYNKLGNIDANAAEILKLDLPKLAPEVAKPASNFCRVWFDHQVPLNVPLAWTQQLPGAMGRNTRLQLAKNKELKPAGVQQFQVWSQTATISPAERAELLTVLNKRLEVPVSK